MDLQNLKKMDLNKLKKFGLSTIKFLSKRTIIVKKLIKKQIFISFNFKHQNIIDI